MKNKRIILCGPSACGKTFIRDQFQKKNYKGDVSYTTRTKRQGEVHKKDYYFMTWDLFSKRCKEDFFFEYVTFGGNFYGTGKKEWAECDIFIMETNGIRNLPGIDRAESLVIYIDTPMLTRLNRMFQRNIGVFAIIKRLYTDYKAFKNFGNYDLKIQS